MKRDALTKVRAAVPHNITSSLASRNMNILQDSDFVPANNMFETQCKLYPKEMNEKQKLKSSIESGDIEKLHRYVAECVDGKNNLK